MSLFDKHKNLSGTLVATAPSPATSGTTLIVTAGDGALQFPAVPFEATIWPTGVRPSKSNSEIVTVTGISTDTLTITRAQESSVARTVIIGDQISANFTAKHLTDLETAFNGIVQGRLTLTTGVPVTTADVTAATNVFFTPYGGNHIALYDGSAWQLYTFSERTLALGTITSDLPYDVFLFDNSGTLTLELLAWTSKTARATALVLQDGVLCKTGALTRRYLGTFHTTATTTTEDSLTKRLLFNYYNRVARPMARLESTSTWTYSTDSYRQANAAVANQLAVLCGWPEDAIEVSVQASYRNDQAANTVGAEVAIGENSTTTPATSNLFSSYFNPGVGIEVPLISNLRRNPAVGYSFYAWLERVTAVGTTTWRGISSGISQSGITGMWRA